MFNRNVLIAAASVTLGFAGSAFAGGDGKCDDKPVVVTDTRTGANESLGQKMTDRSDVQLRQAPVWKGERARNQTLNVGNPLPEKTLLGRVGDIDNSKAGALNHLGSGYYVEPNTAVASDKVIVTPAPMPSDRQVWVERDDSMATTASDRTTSSDGIDNRFIKPADPAVTMPDTKNNAGIDRTLAQDTAIRNSGQRVSDYRTDDSTAFRDVSNHPIDSLNDPAFKGPMVPADDGARTASEVIRPDTTVLPPVAPVDSNYRSDSTTYVPAPVAKPVYTDRTWVDRTGNTDSLGTRIVDRRDVETRQPTVWKGARANNQLLNIGYPLPEKTVFGRVGDIDNSKTGTLNHLGNPNP